MPQPEESGSSWCGGSHQARNAPDCGTTAGKTGRTSCSLGIPELSGRDEKFEALLSFSVSHDRTSAHEQVGEGTHAAPVGSTYSNMSGVYHKNEMYCYEVETNLQNNNS